MRAALPFALLSLLGGCHCNDCPAPANDLRAADLLPADLAPLCIPSGTPCNLGDMPPCCDGIACGASGHCLP